MSLYNNPLPIFKTRDIKITLTRKGFKKEIIIPPLIHDFNLFINILPDILYVEGVRYIKIQTTYYAKIFFKEREKDIWKEKTYFYAGNHDTNLGEYILPIYDMNNIVLQIKAISEDKESFIQTIVIDNDNIVKYNFDIET